MSLPPVSAAAHETTGPATEADTRQQGRWLVMGRVGWGALVIVTLIVVFASLPAYLAQLQTPCTRTACLFQQLTTGQWKTLTGIGWSPGDYAAFTLALALAALAMCLVVSALIMWRRSDDRMALFVALLLVTLGSINITANTPASSPLLVPNEGLTFLSEVLLVLVFLLFPSGQFVPRWMRWTFVVFLVGTTPVSFFPDVPLISNTSVGHLGWLVALVEFATAALVQLYRYWHVSSPLQRQQTKWVIFGFAVPITGLVSQTVLALVFPVVAERSALYLLASNEVGFLLPLFLPLSFGFAILRYRLWDIDELINRVLVYGLLTGLLAAVYIGLIIGLEHLLGLLSGQPSQPVVIVISTLLIVALFQPVRGRIQSIIDRRFYRKKYDAEKTLAGFSVTLQSEVDLEQVRRQLIRVVQETMQPMSVSFWLRQPEHHPRDLTHRLDLHNQVATKPSPD
jgi:hypothetical protein